MMYKDAVNFVQPWSNLLRPEVRRRRDSYFLKPPQVEVLSGYSHLILFNDGFGGLYSVDLCSCVCVL